MAISVVVKPLAAFDVEVYNVDELVFSTHFSGTEEDVQRFAKQVYADFSAADLTTPDEV